MEVHNQRVFYEVDKSGVLLKEKTKVGKGVWIKAKKMKGKQRFVVRKKN